MYQSKTFLLGVFIISFAAPELLYASTFVIEPDALQETTSDSPKEKIGLAWFFDSDSESEPETQETQDHGQKVDSFFFVDKGDEKSTGSAAHAAYQQSLAAEQEKLKKRYDILFAAGCKFYDPQLAVLYFSESATDLTRQALVRISNALDAVHKDDLPTFMSWILKPASIYRVSRMIQADIKEEHFSVEGFSAAANIEDMRRTFYMAPPSYWCISNFMLDVFKTVYAQSKSGYTDSYTLKEMARIMYEKQQGAST